MPRQVLLSNGCLAVALDEQVRIRDIYFPYVGLENHAVGHEFRLGVWANGKFQWVDKDWDTTMSYMAETLTTRYILKNHQLGLQIEINDTIHNESNVFLRKIEVSNATDISQEVRVFLAHDFHIYGYESGDTAFFEPNVNAIVHYKGKRYFLIGGEAESKGFYEYAVGYKEVEGKQGTWRDAEDGRLSSNPVAQGSVDSVVSFKLDMPAEGSGLIHYWIVCGTNLNEVLALNSEVKQVGVEQMLLESENYWSAWLNQLKADLNSLPREIARLYKRSLLLMRAHLDNHGGFVASLDSDISGIQKDTYSYVWPRDGAMAAIAFCNAGFADVASKFFTFCNEAIGENGFFSHKYLPDGSIGSTWHALIDSEGHMQLPIQEDETASVLYALWKYYEKDGNLEFITKVYDRLVVKTADFMVDYRDPDTFLPKSSFDEWEEKVGVFTSTASSVCAALQAAAKFAKVFYDRNRQQALSKAADQIKESMIKHLYSSEHQRFIKGILTSGEMDLTIDSSISSIFTFRVFEPSDNKVKNTMDALSNALWVKTEVGGLARYQNDQYRRISEQTPGNTWTIATLRLARWQIAKAASLEELSTSMNLLRWTSKHALSSGALAEQLDPYSGKPISATPLLWSHAEFVTAVTEYLNKFEEIKNNISK